MGHLTTHKSEVAMREMVKLAMWITVQISRDNFSARQNKVVDRSESFRIWNIVKSKYSSKLFQRKTDS